MDNIKALEARVENLEATLQELCIVLHSYHQDSHFMWGRILRAEQDRCGLLEEVERQPDKVMSHLYNIITKQEK